MLENSNLFLRLPQTFFLFTAVEFRASSPAVVGPTHQVAAAVAVRVTVSLSFIALIVGGAAGPVVRFGGTTYRIYKMKLFIPIFWINFRTTLWV